MVQTAIASLTRAEDTTCLKPRAMLHSVLPPAGGVSVRAISAICRLSCECISRVLVLRAIRGMTW
jgi:hypothetical protein